MVYLVAYDIPPKNGNEAYIARLEATIKGFPNWARIEQGVWIVSTDKKDVAEVRDAIWKAPMAAADRLFVARLSGDWGAYNLPTNIVTWLQGQKYDG